MKSSLALLTVLAGLLVLAHVSDSTAATTPPVWLKENASDVDGTNRMFVLSHTPHSTIEIAVFFNGLYQNDGLDYTVNPTSHRQIRFAEAPPAGSLVSFWYLANQ